MTKIIAFALMLIIDGEKVFYKYHETKQSCLYECQELSRPTKNYQPMECTCIPRLVEKSLLDMADQLNK